MTTPSTDSLKAAPATRPVEIDLAEAPLSAPKITLGQGLPEGMQRVLAAVLLIPAACMLLSIRLIWLVRGVPGPFFFRQDRVGRDAVTFRILKIRTMTDQSGPVFADVEDTRVVPTGKFLRNTHLDELPQLWNVVRGDMLLVGPRPEQPGPHELLSKLLVGYQSRVLMKPGMVALSNLRDGYARSIPEHRRRVVWDRWYIRNRSISTDLILLVQGILRPFRLR
ncbi:MAG: sugar transferase [Planctomycetota bacterium]|nr:sugar transferase [Planctomycetota bacterium]